MPKMVFDLDVEMEDGTAYHVVADQRDFRKWELQPFGWPVAQLEEKLSVHLMRYLAWSAAQRIGQTTLSWKDFDAACVEAFATDDGASDAEDPGRPVP